MASIVNVYSGGTFGNPINIAISAVGSGNSLVLVAQINDGNAPYSVTDNGGSSPTYAEDFTFRNTGSGADVTYFRRANITDAPTQVSVNLNTSGGVPYWLFEVSGIDNSSPVGQTGSTSGNSTSPNISFTTTAAGELGISATVMDNETVQSGGDGWTAVPGTSAYEFTAYKADLGSAGAKSTAITLSNSRGWETGIVTYLPASSGSTAAADPTAAAGSGTVSASGGSRAAATGTAAAGTGTVSAAGAAMVAAGPTAGAGVATVSATGRAVFSGVATAAAGSATASAAAASIASADALASGVGAASAAGTSTAATAATPAEGVATVSAVGSTPGASATATAAQGVASVSAAGSSVAASAPLAAEGAATVSAVGTVVGDTSANAVPSAGEATVSAAGASISASAGQAAGAASVAATGTGLRAASAVQADGTASVSATARSTSAAAFVPAAGSALASVLGASTAVAIVVPADGVATVSAVGSSAEAIEYTRAPSGSGYSRPVFNTVRPGTSNSSRSRTTNTRRP